MNDKNEHEPGQIELVPNDAATAMDPARIGSRRTEAMPLNVQVNSGGPWDRTSPDKLPATLIRSLDGCICAWSHGMESRYGFPASQAVGLPAHQLLRTISCRTLDEINRQLLDQRTWRGGLVHHRLDGRPIMTASSWHLHRKFRDEALFVTEVHADIVPSGSAVGTQFADVLSAITHELSEALTAVRLYSEVSRRALCPVWPDRVLAVQGMSRGTEQIARATDIVVLMRKLTEQIRGSNCRDRIDRQFGFQSTAIRNDGGKT